MLSLLYGGLYAKQVTRSLGPDALVHQTTSHRPTICRFPPLKADSQMYLGRIEPCTATHLWRPDDAVSLQRR
jgi:hypothetical protein